jgi:ESCRT-I complex subunit VPS28
MNTPISLDEEARLYTTNSEREKYNTLATLYGIIVALDYLERAYVRDSITSAECVEWQPSCAVLKLSIVVITEEIFAGMHAALITV